MATETTHWQLVAGDGIIYDGPCLVTHIIFYPYAGNDYVDIYDGRDTTSGKKFCRIHTGAQRTFHMGFGSGILFGHGIYVDGIDDDVETTVGYVPME